MNNKWLSITPEFLTVELAQLKDEGRDPGGLEAEFRAWLDRSPEEFEAAQPALNDLVDRAAALPFSPEALEREPSDLASIRKLRPAPASLPPPSAAGRADRLLGAWLGRCCGCLLGKPVEGWLRDRLHGYLKETGRYPLAGYLRSDVAPAILERYQVKPGAPFINRVDRMVADDDTNYTVLGLVILEERGLDFTQDDVASVWLRRLPILTTCTAERVAYRNLANLLLPPASATFRNPYREWIGAQIRADIYGYINPGRPKRAAELAWRDASVSHTGNGIYGAMWVAAMLAAAALLDDPAGIIRAGLRQVPAASRLTEAVSEVFEWRRQGLDLEAAIGRLHAGWDESFSHHWCHTLSNAQAVALGLLWGEGDFGRSVCAAVQAAFDTDCNGATVGSILGMRLGAGRLPAEWTGPLHDTLETGLSGLQQLRISELAGRTLKVETTA